MGYTGDMNIYFSGIGGVGIGPLAQIARDVGHKVVGSDLAESIITDELRLEGVEINIGQDGSFLRLYNQQTPIDWFVYTSALPDDHPELLAAKELGIRATHRDEFLAYVIQEKGLKLIAVAGTHGKTTTTGMMVWVMQNLGIPISYSVGSALSFGPSGKYDPTSEYFVYECDEYDQNFLNFYPCVSVITSIDYDHPDTYPTEESYKAAFKQFLDQSDHSIIWQDDADFLGVNSDKKWLLQKPDTLDLMLAGLHNRQNATLVVKALEYLKIGDADSIINKIEAFPGTSRRFEKLGDNLFSDYGHHPAEIAATLQMAREITEDVVLVYQPHQNKRQHQIADQYKDQFEQAQTVYWLPTYLSREDPDQPILTPDELSGGLTNRDSVITAEMDDQLWQNIQQARQSGKLVLCMGAGNIDGWVRKKLGEYI